MPPATNPAVARPPALAQLYANVTEAAWQRDIEAYLAAGGWLFAHIRDARGQHVTGLPDIIALRARTSTGPAEILALELKTERGRTTKEQDRWLDLLRRAGVPAYVLRPSDVDTAKRLLVDDEEQS